MTAYATTTPLRNRHTVGRCGTPHCTDLARLYPCGWRCDNHRPQPGGAA